MSSAGGLEAVPPSPSAPKRKKSRKKKAGNKIKTNGELVDTNGTNTSHGEYLEEEESEPETPIVGNHTEITPADNNGTEISIEDEGRPERDVSIEERPPKSPIAIRPRATTMTKAPAAARSGNDREDMQARSDNLAKERTALQEEVSRMRKSLETLQGRHDEEIGSVRRQLEDTRGEKEQAESNYRTLLDRVNTIKSQLGERLKSDAEDLSQARTRIEELGGQNEALRIHNDSRSEELATLAAEADERSKELSTLRNRMNLSQQNWVKEKEEFTEKEAYAKAEFESAKQAMQDWEVLAMEERSIRENLAEKAAELEEQVTSHREAHERLESERQSQSLTVDGLQRALQELQEARKQELRELVENSQTQIRNLRKELEAAQETAAKSTQSYESAQKELERVMPFESEVKEKNLLIGKLRHEGVILNDHITRALRQLKKGKQEDLIDKQLVTNHILRFLALDRADPRKFQVLQIIASMLEWSDDQMEQAGLARPGASNINLRAPISPWHRTPSTPSLTSNELVEAENRGRTESLGGLFSQYLEKESEDGGTDTRSASISSSRKQFS